MLLRQGSAVDDTFIAAPSSTKNRDSKRDPEMHSSKKGNQWYFRMKAHFGVDAALGLVHTVRGTAGHVADVTEGNSLPHRDETVVFADTGYQGAQATTGRLTFAQKLVDGGSWTYKQSAAI